jgi:hypothetical protein
LGLDISRKVCIYPAAACNRKEEDDKKIKRVRDKKMPLKIRKKNDERGYIWRKVETKMCGCFFFPRISRHVKRRGILERRSQFVPMRVCKAQVISRNCTNRKSPPPQCV